MLLACITSHQLYYITSSLHHLDVLHHLTSEYTNRANLVYYTRCHMYYKGFTFTDEQAFRLFFHRHSGRQGCCVGLAGHAPASDSPGFARSDPRQARAGATLSARTQRGAQEREPSPPPPENRTHAPDLVDATGRARSRRASSHWAGVRRADRRRETVHCGASRQRVYYRSCRCKTSKNGRQLPSPLMYRM